MVVSNSVKSHPEIERTRQCLIIILILCYVSLLPNF